MLPANCTNCIAAAATPSAVIGSIKFCMLSLKLEKVGMRALNKTLVIEMCRQLKGGVLYEGRIEFDTLGMRDFCQQTNKRCRKATIAATVRLVC
ncbi:hypothetical protein GQ53DRAFT_361180 [Thozetella sp. PMI_491]|nr:hypothetical protein GQ53DRAFT_361180 [Thozetella sp. PMI_491]